MLFGGIIQFYWCFISVIKKIGIDYVCRPTVQLDFLQCINEVLNVIQASTAVHGRVFMLVRI